ncbi:MAG: phosphotransferase, partial [Candidatus Omnitrophica bacterium]|nr:phosphotransferase [Candidatus Omnitrophota bacterium]
MHGTAIRVKDATIHHIEEAARIAARINNALVGFSPEVDRRFKTREAIGAEVKSSITEYAGSLQQIPAKDLDDVQKLILRNFEFFMQQTTIFETNYSQELRASLSTSPIHNDLHLGNLLFNEEGKAAGVFDFGFAQTDRRVLEFNNMLMGRDTLKAGVPYSRDKLIAAIRAYQEMARKKLNEQEVRGIIEIIRLRFLEDIRTIYLKGAPTNVFEHPELAQYVEQTLEAFHRFAEEFSDADKIRNFALSHLAEESVSSRMISPSMTVEEIWRALYGINVKEDARLESLKAPENNKGQPITAFDHVRNLVTFEDRLRQAEAVNDIEAMTSIVTERRDLKAPELAPSSVRAFVEYYRNIRNSPGNMSKFMILRMAIVLHDLGKLAGHGEDAISGEKYAKEYYIPALIADKVITEEEAELLTALIYLHTDFGTLHFGEVLPSSVEKYLAANNVSGRYKGWFYELAPILYVLDVGSVGAINGGKLSTTHLDNAMWMARPENVAQLTAGWDKTRLYMGFCGDTNAKLGYWPIIDFTRSAAIDTTSYPDVNAGLDAIAQADRVAFDEFLRDKMSFEAHAIYIFRFMNELSNETKAGQSALVKFFYIMFKLRQAMPEFTMLHFTPTNDEKGFGKQLCAKMDNITMEEIASFNVDKGENAVDAVGSRFGLPIKADGAKVIYNTTAPAQQLLLIGISVPAPEAESTIREVTARLQATGIGGVVGQVIAIDDPESLAKIASERGMTGIFIDSTIKVQSMDNSQFSQFTRDLSEIKLTKHFGIVFTAANIDRDTRNKIKELIIAVIGAIEHKSPAEIFALAQDAMKTNPEDLHSNIVQLRDLLAARRAQLVNSGQYSTIAIDQALASERKVAIATTEKVAMSEPTFAMNIARTRDHGTVNSFIYGEIFSTEE